MNILQRALAFFRGRKQPESKFADATAEELLSTAERLMLEAVRSYKPAVTDRGSRYAQAEYAPFMFFWAQHWHDQQPQVLRDYDIILKLLMSKAQDGAMAIRSFHSLHFQRGWDPDRWFADRVRIYRSILASEPQQGSRSAPPSIFTASHMLATLSSRSCTLDMWPTVTRSADLIEQCLSRGIFPDALEQFNLYSHAKASLGVTLPLLSEIITEMHLRRLANQEGEQDAAATTPGHRLF